MSQSTKYDFSRVRDALYKLWSEDRGSYRALFKLVLKIEGLKNPITRAWALKLFCEVLEILSEKTS